MAESNARSGYSVEAAIAYAKGKIAYCDRMAAAWPDAVEHMTALRALASRFLAILEHHPNDLPNLLRLHEDLRSGRPDAGTGWTMLTDWVEMYIGGVQEECDSSKAPEAADFCKQCGHPFAPHRVLGYGQPPTEGWMECPVEGCDCHMTWSMAPPAGSSS